MSDYMRYYSPAYKALQEQFHLERGDYGISGHKYADQILQLAKSMKSNDILDYGCGKCTLGKALPFPIKQYDPFIPQFSALPSPADIVVCTDVMEHVEEDYVDDVLAHIAELTNKVAFFEIATRPAAKVLPDGRNAHITQYPASWWLRKLCVRMEPLSFQNFGGSFVFMGGLPE